MFNKVILLTIGDIGVVTYTVISYASNMVLNTMLAVSQGVQPLISFNFGKKDNNAIFIYFKLALKVVTVFSILSYGICTVFSNTICRVFINSNEVNLINYSIKSLRIYALSYLIVGYNVVLAGFYSSVEKPKFALVISLGRGLIVISIVLVFMTNLFGDTGIWLSPFISEILVLIVSIGIFIKQFLCYFNNKKISNKIKIIQQ
ncbi:MATE family efflux transporter [Sedimentibacter sp. zth1]|uniref:MATE family efflux transporter n=1 Tax=Sedimentibacter sp. zth1 TaxID=2816908 RepID=UPI001F5FD2C1